MLGMLSIEMWWDDVPMVVSQAIRVLMFLLINDILFGFQKNKNLEERMPGFNLNKLQTSERRIVLFDK